MSSRVRVTAWALVAFGFVSACTSAGLPGAGGALDQVDKAYQAEINVALTDASKAQQNYAASHGMYASDLSALVSEYGLNVSPDITLTIARADASSYCVQATHAKAEGAWHISPESPTPAAGAC